MSSDKMAAILSRPQCVNVKPTLRDEQNDPHLHNTFYFCFVLFLKNSRYWPNEQVSLLVYISHYLNWWYATIICTSHSWPNQKLSHNSRKCKQETNDHQLMHSKNRCKLNAFIDTFKLSNALLTFNIFFKVNYVLIQLIIADIVLLCIEWRVFKTWGQWVHRG